MRTPVILITTIVVISAVNNLAEGEDRRYTTMTKQIYICSECTVHTVLSTVYDGNIHTNIQVMHMYVCMWTVNLL